MAKLATEPREQVGDEPLDGADGGQADGMSDTDPGRTDAEPGASEGGEAAESAAMTRLRSVPWRRAAASLLVAALLGAIAATPIQARDWWENKGIENDRVDAMDAAKTVALAVSRSDYKTIDEDLDTVLDHATGDFASTIRTNEASQKELVKAYKVRSTSKVEEVGVVSQAAKKVVVAVAVSSNIKNSRNPKGQEQWYRMVIDMEPAKDDRWLASNVEFVQ